ncbi:MAG TPA: hypothetical protein VIY52_30815 [Streptosporangiaceae bacterium]
MTAVGDLSALQSIPPRLNPHVDAARSHLSSWVARYGLVRRSRAQERFDRADFAWFAAQTYPTADETGACLIADWFAWLFLLDDRFDDGFVGLDLERMNAIVADLMTVLLSGNGRPGQAPAEASAIVAALADLWRRTTPLTTRRWQDRFVGHIATGGAAACWEADNRVPDRATYIENRRHTGAIYVCMDLIEAVEAIDLPPEVEQDLLFQRTLMAACDVVCWTNDFYSAEKEARLGEAHNLVLVVEHSEGLSRAAASEIVARDTGTKLRRFVTLEPRLQAAWPAYAVLLGKYLDGMRSWMRRNVDWSRRTLRYSAEPEFTGCPQDYLEQVYEPGVLVRQGCELTNVTEEPRTTTLTVPHGILMGRRLVRPALPGWLAQLNGELSEICRYHFGLANAGAAIDERHGGDKAHPQCLAHPRRHHGPRPAAAISAEHMVAVRRSLGHSRRRRSHRAELRGAVR